MNRAVFLDRDGVLNKAIVRDGRPYPPANPEELVILDGVFEALQQLKAAGFYLIVVTNQPDVARGHTTKEKIEAMHNKLQYELPCLDAIRVCYHDDADQCVCRKPAPGLLQQAAHDYHIALSASFVVGDRWRDIAAGQSLHCKTIWLDYAYKEQKPQNPDLTTHSLLAATPWIIIQ